MNKMVFAAALVGATVILLPAQQAANIPDPAPAAADLEQDLGLDRGSQEAVSAPLAIEQPVIRQDYSQTMHLLTGHMLKLPASGQNEVAWFAKALDTHQTEAPGNDLTARLSFLAQSLANLSDVDRKAVVDLASTLTDAQ